MTKSDEVKFPLERVRAAQAPEPRPAPRPAQSKKERPASKGRVHKGRTRS